MNDAIEKNEAADSICMRVRASAKDTGAIPPLLRPIDTESLLARCMGKRSLALSLLSELERTGAERVAEIGRLAEHAEFEAVVQAAHSLKGAMAILAAEPVRALAAGIEVVGQARSETQLLELVELLDDEMKRCLDFIPVFRAGAESA